MTIQVNDLVVRRTNDNGKVMKVDGFVSDAMGKLWVALSDPETGMGMGCLKKGQVVLAEVMTKAEQESSR